MSASDVNSREDFLKFTSELSKDLERGASYWQNTDLPSFLEMINYWTAHEMDANFERNGVELERLSPWRIMAEILEAASMYE